MILTIATRIATVTGLIWWAAAMVAAASAAACRIAHRIHRRRRGKFDDLMDLAETLHQPLPADSLAWAETQMSREARLLAAYHQQKIKP